MANVAARVQNTIAAIIETLNRIPGVNLGGSDVLRGAARRNLRLGRQAGREQAALQDALAGARGRRQDFFSDFDPSQGIIAAAVDRALQSANLDIPSLGNIGAGGSTFRRTEFDPVEDVETATPTVDDSPAAARRRRTPARRVADFRGGGGGRSGGTNNFEFTFNFYGDVEREGIEERLITQIQRAIDRGRVRVAV